MEFTTPPALQKTIIALHVSAALNIFPILAYVGYFILILFQALEVNEVLTGEFLSVTAVLLILLVIQVSSIICKEALIYFLKRGKPWSWIASVVFNILRCFLLSPTAVVALIGLLNDQVMAAYQAKKHSPSL